MLLDRVESKHIEMGSKKGRSIEEGDNHLFVEIHVSDNPVCLLLCRSAVYRENDEVTRI